MNVDRRQMLVDRSIMVEMRDGVHLATDVFRPATEVTVPAVLFRTPYGRDVLDVPLATINRYSNAGYAVVIQDTRGSFASEGFFVPFVHEADDGEDAIAWVAAQEWSDGDVVMGGASYCGAAQWTAAAKAPRALRAIAPHTTGSSFYEGWSYFGGAFQLGFLLSWTLTYLAFPEGVRRIEAGDAPDSLFAEMVAANDNIEQLYRLTPLSEIDLLKNLAPYYRDWLTHSTDDPYWRRFAPREHYQDVVVPSLNIGGWYDLFLGGTLANFIGMRERGGSDTARDTRLIVGPWSHSAPMEGEYPEASFGASSASSFADVVGSQIAFFDEVLGRSDLGDASAAPVKIFVMGANVWRDEEAWPLPDSRYTKYYLHSSGAAARNLSDGTLSLNIPGDEPADSYLYDPHDPVPTIGGQTFLPRATVAANEGPRDQTLVEQRSDVLCFSSPVLDEPVEVTGPVVLSLFASSSCIETDFTGKLVDVFPDGRAMILTDGILRACFRDSDDFGGKPPSASTGIREFVVDLVATSNVFLPGHRIRLEVSSSNFPRFDRNSNAGDSVSSRARERFAPALNRIYHDRERPSHLVLPIIRRGDG